LAQPSFSLWINPISFLEKKDNTIVLGCPNKFSCNWISENYLDLIREKFDKVGSNNYDITLKVKPLKRQTSLPKLINDPKQLTFHNIPSNGGSTPLGLNRDFTFDRFVVGRCNEFAFSASKAIAFQGNWNYHSLLMLANTGLGKSHLSQAVGHAIRQQSPKSRVMYITAEDFTNEMIYSLKTNSIDQFKNKYRRSCDILLLDEIHFLGGKEKTQLEVGYTLDALANDDKRILFTSSLAPEDIPKMSKELSSRLTSGLVTTIDKPDFEMRMKILTKKASEHNISLSEKVVGMLASKLNRDVRQMESALRCLKAKSEFLNVKINSSLAKDVLKCLVSEEQAISLSAIKKLVCKYYKVAPEMLESKSRKKIASVILRPYQPCLRSSSLSFRKFASPLDLWSDFTLRSIASDAYSAVEWLLFIDLAISSSVPFECRRQRYIYMFLG